MTLTATQLANTTAAAFDIQFRYFGGQTFSDLTLSHYTRDGTPTGWTISGETITPAAGWTEITSRVYFNGNLRQTWSGSTIDWSCKLQGDTYSDDYLAEDLAIACFYRITRAGYDSGWSLFWLGMVSDVQRRDDYRGGDLWTATVTSLKPLLARYESPRVEAGAIDIMQGASVTASSELSTPGVEVANGEFVNATEDVSASNVADGRMETVWISQDAPSKTTETVPSGSRIKIDEVFFSPASGWNEATTWWIELVGLEETDLAVHEVSLYTYNTNGNIVGLRWRGKGARSYVLGAGERGVICANKARFEAYTGGASGAAWVVEASTFDRFIYGSYDATDEPFDLATTDGYLWLRGELTGDWDVVKWCDTPGSSSVSLHPSIDPAHWVGNEFDSSTLVAGESFRRTPTGTDTNTAADWARESYPIPGGGYETASDEWVLIELARDASTLTSDISIGATTIPLSSTVGWPDSGDGIVESDDFSYTGRTASALTGVTGITSAHLANVEVWPYYDGETQKGWRLARLEVKRRGGLSAIEAGRLYLSHLEASALRNASESGFEADWDHKRSFGNSRAVWAWNTTNLVYPWVKSLMLVIDSMTDGGRAKINEVVAVANQADINSSGLADITSTSAALAAYIISQSSWLDSDDLTDETSYTLPDSSTDVWGELGEVQTAVTAIPRVLDDIARQTGCLCVYALDGGITWRRDPWWLGGPAGSEPEITWTTSNLRNEVKFRRRTPTAGGIRVEANLPDGTPLYAYTYPPNATGTTLMSRDGYTVTHEGKLWELAHALYLREVVPHEALITVKGIGEWCQPGQWHNINWDGDSNELYFVNSVTWTWNNAGGKKSWRCDLGLTYYG